MCGTVWRHWWTFWKPLENQTLLRRVKERTRKWHSAAQKLEGFSLKHHGPRKAIIDSFLVRPLSWSGNFLFTWFLVCMYILAWIKNACQGCLHSNLTFTNAMTVMRWLNSRGEWVVIFLLKNPMGENMCRIFHANAYFK